MFTRLSVEIPQAGPIPGWDLPERRKWRIRLEDFE